MNTIARLTDEYKNKKIRTLIQEIQSQLKLQSEREIKRVYKNMKALLYLGMVKKGWMPPSLLEKYQMVLELRGYSSSLSNLIFDQG